MTPLLAVCLEPLLLTDPILPQGPLLDEFGQSTLNDWPGKTANESELVDRLRTQADEAPRAAWPSSWTRFGGWRDTAFAATGFFRTHHDGHRWWLVDPEGHAFWSAGINCVRPQIESHAHHLQAALTWSPVDNDDFAEACRQGPTNQVNFLCANFIRAFGPDAWRDQWAALALAQLRAFGFNTVANWSDWKDAANAGMPYVRPLSWPAAEGPHAPRIFRDFPDPFHPQFQREARSYAEQLRVTRDDPALIGYFLMNEPQWGFTEITPAEGMLLNSDHGPARDAFADFLRHLYGNEANLAAVWGPGITFQSIECGRWRETAPAAARPDLEAFSTVMVEKLYRTLNEACRSVDPNHLNLGARYHRVPPHWAMLGMAGFDVFSVNNYRETVDRNLAHACEKLRVPAMIGEWHFGALDVGLPASGIGRVASQEDRGRAFRVYAEDAAAQPWCVGVHYFTLYDQSALGRFDGENYNIGFLDVCHKAYQPLAEAARLTHARIYEIAAGRLEPFQDAPEYLPKLFY